MHTAWANTPLPSGRDDPLTEFRVGGTFLTLVNLTYKNIYREGLWRALRSDVRSDALAPGRRTPCNRKPVSDQRHPEVHKTI